MPLLAVRAAPIVANLAEHRLKLLGRQHHRHGFATMQSARRAEGDTRLEPPAQERAAPDRHRSFRLQTSNEHILICGFSQHQSYTYACAFS